MDYILYEHLSGYELFRLKSYQGISAESYSNYSVLTQVVEHVSTYKFTNIDEIIDVLNSNLSYLEKFLKFYSVKSLHADRSLKKPLEDLGIKVETSPNIMRGIKQNIHKILKRNTDKQILLGVSHRHARNCLQYDMEREDHLLAIVENEIEDLENEIGVLESQKKTVLNGILPNYKNLEKGIGNGEDLRNIVDSILNINPRNSKIDGQNNNDLLLKMVLEEARKEVNEADTERFRLLDETIQSKEKLLESMKEYLHRKVRNVAPNLQVILGDRLTSKFLEQSGSLMNLSLMPSSTVQLLGAEKALFKSLKAKKPTPKHGLLYGYGRRISGKFARYVATKCSLAARIDYFSEERTDSYGKELKKMIDRRDKKYQEGKTKTTADIMKDVHLVLEKSKKEKTEIPCKKPSDSVKIPRERTKKSLYDMTESTKKKINRKHH